MRLALRSEPIADPALLARFTALADRCRALRPLFEHVNLRGGAIANAVALASMRRPAVVFSDTLLARLDHDEAAAICAHELAHLEYYDPLRLRRIGAVNVLLIVTGAALAPAARLAGLSSTVIPLVPWLALFMTVLILRARDRQRNETASDLRAVELTGDAETLVRALTKLHTFARVPRRLDAQHEQHATHPSLARRIRDIRKAAGVGPLPTVDGATFTGADRRTVVAFQEDRLNWSEGEAVTHSLSYAHLSELRLHARYAGPPALIAVERSGRRWEMALAAEDVARAQAVLDRVDGRLPDPVPPPSFIIGLKRSFIVLG
jgi:hypothetical protein